MSLVIFSGVLGISSLLRHREARALEVATATALEATTNEVEHRTRDQLRALERLAADWTRRGGLPRSAFESAAEALTRDFSFIQAIEWVDPSFHVRWIVPLAGNEAAQDLDLAHEVRRRAALEASREGRVATASRPIQLVQGGLGFLVYAPLRVDDRFDGFVVGVCRAEALLSGLLRNVAQGFAIRVEDDGELLYVRGLGEGAWPRARTAPLRRSLRPWSIEVAPGPEIIATYQTHLPLMVFIAGAALALVFGGTTQLALSRHLRSRQLEAEVAKRRAREEKLSRVVEALPDHVWCANITAEGVETVYFSPMLARITGRPADMFEGSLEAWYETVHEEDLESLQRVNRELLTGQRDSFEIEYRIFAADGGLRWVRDRVHTNPTEHGKRIDGVTSDISAMKRAEAERIELETNLQQRQKLESLGVLAGGIAHDFNNLLVGVLGNARIAFDDLPEGAPVRVPLRRIQRAAKRATELCRQMVAYAGQVSVETEPLDLREMVEEVGQLLAASTSKKIELVYDFEEELPLVEVDATQIRQVVLNLVTNAAEAIGDRTGTIRVIAAHREQTRAELDRLELGQALEPGVYVTVTVTDDGCGMDDETRRRFMEPFFSTKSPGRGLGLAAVQGIARRHHGAIDVQTVLGRGTSITLLLSAARSTAPIARIESAAPRRARASGTILLIDDDEDARELGAIVLERAGFQPVTAENGVEGVAALRAHQSEVLCVLLDLTMPHLDGADALRALRTVRDDVPVILCSGYPEAKAMERFAGLGLTAFLAKPYLPDELLAKIDAALADPCQAGLG